MFGFSRHSGVNVLILHAVEDFGCFHLGSYKLVAENSIIPSCKMLVARGMIFLALGVS